MANHVIIHPHDSVEVSLEELIQAHEECMETDESYLTPVFIESDVGSEQHDDTDCHTFTVTDNTSCVSGSDQHIQSRHDHTNDSDAMAGMEREHDG